MVILAEEGYIGGWTGRWTGRYWVADESNPAIHLYYTSPFIDHFGAYTYSEQCRETFWKQFFEILYYYVMTYGKFPYYTIYSNGEKFWIVEFDHDEAEKRIKDILKLGGEGIHKAPTWIKQVFERAVPWKYSSYYSYRFRNKPIKALETAKKIIEIAFDYDF